MKNLNFSREPRCPGEARPRSGGCYDPRGCWTRRLPAAPGRGVRSALQEEWHPLLARDLVSLQLPLGRAAGSPGQCCLFLDSCEAGRAAPVLLWAQIWAPTARLPAGFWNVPQPRHNLATGAGKLRPRSVRGLGVILGWWGGGVAGCCLRPRQCNLGAAVRTRFPARPQPSLRTPFSCPALAERRKLAAPGRPPPPASRVPPAPSWMTAPSEKPGAPPPLGWAGDFPR